MRADRWSLFHKPLCALPAHVFYRSKKRNTRGWQPWQLIVASRDREKEMASESVLAVHLKSSSARVLKMSLALTRRYAAYGPR
jgi:hypothetical protein